MHEFLEDGLPNGKERFSLPVSGRITTFGKYMSYARKEIAAGQEMIIMHVMGWLHYNEAPAWAFDAFNFYRDLGYEMQMCANILCVFYLLAMQYYFIRHMLCDSCFREWK